MERCDCFTAAELLWMARYDYYAGWVLNPHAHDDYWQMIYAIGGSAKTTVDGKTHPFHDNCLLFLPPRTVHAISDVGRDGLKTIDVKFTLDADADISPIRRVPTFIPSPPSDIATLFAALHSEGDRKDWGWRTASSLILGNILLLLSRMQMPLGESGGEGTGSPFHEENFSSKTLRLVAFIQNNYRRKITADDMTEACHYSYRYLSTLARKEAGFSPKEMVDRWRIYVAQQMLATTDKTIKVIAEETGSGNIHQFSRTFRRVTGTTPARWKREHMAKVWQDIRYSETFTNINHTDRRKGK